MRTLTSLSPASKQSSPLFTILTDVMSLRFEIAALEYTGRGTLANGFDHLVPVCKDRADVHSEIGLVLKSIAVARHEYTRRE